MDLVGLSELVAVAVVAVAAPGMYAGVNLGKSQSCSG